MHDAPTIPSIPMITELQALDRVALLDLWRATFTDPPPKRLSAPFLRRFIAFELQARRLGGLPKGFQRRLAAATAPKAKRPVALQTGGRLLREWNGVTHTVDVVDGGYLWQGDHYRSLSAIARAITGARWSGPRFFGVKDQA